MRDFKGLSLTGHIDFNVSPEVDRPAREGRRIPIDGARRRVITANGGIRAGVLTMTVEIDLSLSSCGGADF